RSISDCRRPPGVRPGGGDRAAVARQGTAAVPRRGRAKRSPGTGASLCGGPWCSRRPRARRAGPAAAGVPCAVAGQGRPARSHRQFG
nr:hypothetical protein [Tanacetum cinerariifolium]